MKNICILINLILLLLTSRAISQNETLYMWKNGININQQSIRTADLDSITFTTPEVLICNQVWATRNLDVSTYRNGDPIPQVTNPTQWENLTTGAWCYYNNDLANGPIYGKLYNWYAVNDPRGLAPIGWHVPTRIETSTLRNCLEGTYVAGGKMKSTGTIEMGTGLWLSPNFGATNSSGFAGLPGGWRSGIFEYVGFIGWWWTSSETSTTAAYRDILHSEDDDYTSGAAAKYFGFSVRCLKD